MSTRMFALNAILTATLFSASLALADSSDVDIPVNGDFRGTPSGYSPAPGWTLTADGGQARVLPTTDINDFALEILAAANRSQSVVSDLYPLLSGNMLKIALKVRGTGSAAFGFEAFDQSRTVSVASDRQSAALSGYDQKLQRSFALPPQARFVRFFLTAEAGSTAVFRDVEADVSIAPATAAPAPVAAPAPATAAPAPVAAPVANPVSAPAPSPASAPAVTMPPAGTKILQNDRFYSFGSLEEDAHFEISLPCGSDIDFDLGEDVEKGQYWRLLNVDPSVCRVKIEHDQDGFFPFRRDKAEIELKALNRGSTVAIFSCGPKKVTVHFTAQ